MSRKAKKPINISNVELTYNDNKVHVKGKHGELDLTLTHNVVLKVESDLVYVTADPITPYVGLYFSLLNNMVNGVTNKFTEILTLNGVGYRATFANNVLNLNLGFSHPVNYTVPEGVTLEMETPTQIKLSSCDNQLLGQVAAQIISYRPAKKDPYKHKGIKRINDVLVKKAGKKVG